MAKLQKMWISGIRSFGPFEQDKQVIEFSSPLTIFLGQNGCGKTTIIEALKFACSGDLPEGSSCGQSFVNDPKINKLCNTKGQVRLKIVDAKGIEYTILKSVSVVQKGEKQQFSRPDNTIIVKKDGEKHTISGKCADLDHQSREVLGVSGPILSNVIFCHQENSSWPLEDGKKLKEKFDQIFDATKYNKCVDVNRKQLKEMKDRLKTLNCEMEIKHCKKQQVEKLKLKLVDLQDKLAGICQDVQEKQNKLNPTKKRITEVLAIEQNISDIQKSLAVKENEKRSIQEQQKLILNNLDTEYEGDDYDLKNEIETFGEKQEKMKSKAEELKTRKDKVDSEEDKISKEITKKQVKIGELKEEKKQFDELCVEREKLIKKAKKDLNVHCETDFKNAESIKNTLLEMQRALDKEKTAFEKTKLDFDTKDQEKQHIINETTKELNKTKYSIETKNNLIAEKEKKIRDINCELQGLSFSDSQMSTLKDKIKNIEDNLELLKNSNDISAYDASIHNEKRVISEKEELLNELSAEYKILLQNATTESNIETQKSEIHRYETDLNKLKTKDFQNLKEIFGNDLPESGYQKAIRTLLKIQNNLFEDTNNKILRKDKEFTTVNMKLSSQQEKLKGYITELNTYETEISSLCKNRPFTQVLNDTQLSIERLQKEKGQLSSAKIIYEKFIQDFETEKPCCPVCRTDFSNKKQITQEIVKSIRSKIKEIPNELVTLQTKLSNTQELYNKLMQKKPAYEKIKTLKEQTVPQLQEQVDVLEKAKQRLQDEIKNFKQSIEEPKKKLEICRNLDADCAIIDQCISEITRSKSKIASLESELLKVKSNRNKQQTEIDMENAKVDIESAQKNCANLQKKKDNFKARYHDLMDEKNKLIQQQLDLQKSLQNKPQLEEQLKETLDMNENLKAELLELQFALKPLEIELDEAIKIKEKAKAENNKLLETNRSSLHENAKLLEEVQKLQKKIEKASDRLVEDQFNKAIEDLKVAKETQDSLKAALNKINVAISEIHLKLKQEDMAFKNLKSNVELRSKRKQEEKLTTEIEEIEKKIGGMNTTKIFAEKQELAATMEKLNSEIHKIGGQKKELETQITDVEKELKLPDNTKAEALYKQKFFQHLIMREAIKDLEKYTRVLEKTLIEYHKSCMVQVNRTIRELWRSVYRGNDIDHIEIKTEDCTSSSTRRSYNYKVIQVKNNVEMDFRGRCSAGQKVLACLIIRMALAERFSSNCGILALDEPTTNLDKENIASLSSALARIVNERRSEKNFQLLIITHDEEFLEELKSVGSCSYYMRVTRDKKGNSVITKVDC